MKKIAEINIINQYPHLELTDKTDSLENVDYEFLRVEA